MAMRDKNILKKSVPNSVLAAKSLYYARRIYLKDLGNVAVW